MADDDSANEARKGREAADAAREERGAASAKASDEAGASVASGAGSQAAAKGSSKAAADEGPPTYTLDRLTADSFGFLGVEQHVAAGALHGVTEKEMTIKDAKARVKAWLKSEVDTGPDEEV